MKKLVLIITLIAMPLMSQAQDAVYLSGMLGLNQLSVSGSNNDFDWELSYGGRAGLLFNDHFSAGIYLQRLNTEASNVTNGPEYTMDNVMAEVTYYFNEVDENTFWVSGLLGMTFVETSSAGLSFKDDATAYGAAAGYSFAVSPNFTISPQVTYIQSSFPNTSSQLSGLVNLTFWL